MTGPMGYNTLSGSFGSRDPLARWKARLIFQYLVSTNIARNISVRKMDIFVKHDLMVGILLRGFRNKRFFCTIPLIHRRPYEIFTFKKFFYFTSIHFKILHLPCSLHALLPLSYYAHASIFRSSVAKAQGALRLEQKA